MYGITMVSNGQLAQNGTSATKCSPRNVTRESSAPDACFSISDVA